MKSASIGIVDLGSNSVRMVLYRKVGGVLQPFFNEKYACALGLHLHQTRKLNTQGRAEALEVVRRFMTIAGAYGVQQLYAVATEAIRRADDGQAFVDDIHAQTGLAVDVLSGEQESYYSALGVTHCMPEARGLCGDLGGASLELAHLNGSTITQTLTLPCGVLTFLQQGDITTARKRMQAYLATITDSPELAAPVFYAVGGSWRSLARFHQQVNDYPIDQAHYFHIDRHALQPTLERLIKNGHKGKKLPGVARGRVETMPYAALIMDCLIDRYTVEQVVFSSSGLREGYLAAKIAHGTSRNLLLDEAAAFVGVQHAADPWLADLLRWLQPLFLDVSPRLHALIEAAAVLSDIAHQDVRDHQGIIAFTRCLYAPFSNASHQEHAFLALTLYIRYHGEMDNKVLLQPALRLLSPDWQRQALKVGLALRLAKSLSGGADHLLATVPVQLHKGVPVITELNTLLLNGSERFNRRLQKLQESWLND